MRSDSCSNKKNKSVISQAKIFKVWCIIDETIFDAVDAQQIQMGKSLNNKSSGWIDVNVIVIVFVIAVPDVMVWVVENEYQKFVFLFLHNGNKEKAETA